MNIKSEKGFTMQDLIIAMAIMAILVGVVSSIMISWYKINMETIVSGNATYYAIQIMEKVDRVSYADVTDEIITSWIDEIGIPSVYKVNFNVEYYTENNEGENVIKKVELIISYGIGETEEKIVINKLKMKEINL